MSIETYITIHDQDLLLECEANGQFAAVSHTYLFVGPRPIDRVPDVKIVVARDYTPNYEHLPHFYDFTGWWVLARHALIDTDHVMFLQYDMTITHPSLERLVERRLTQNPGMIAFTAGHKGPNWMLGIPKFRAAFDAGLAVRGVNQDDFPDFNEWPSTQGTAWRTDQLRRYMAWFTPMFDEFADHTYAGHLAERTVKAWCTIDDPEQFLPGAIRHEGRDCHGTCALMAGKKKLAQERAATFGR